jgi:heme exporter protein C
LNMNMLWKILFGIYMVFVILGAFLYAPTAKGLGETTRVLFFHVPCAWIATLSFLVSAVYSIRYLKNRNLKLDLKASSAAQIGLVFTVLATITGSIWANAIWHSYWNWDPRESSIFILLLIYAAYFALRSAVEEKHQKARLSSVYSVLAFVTVPFLIFVVPRIVESLHPDPLINAQGKIEMDSRMSLVFFGSFIGFTVLFFWMLYLKIQTVRLSQIKLNVSNGD